MMDFKHETDFPASSPEDEAQSAPTHPHAGHSGCLGSPRSGIPEPSPSPSLSPLPLPLPSPAHELGPRAHKVHLRHSALLQLAARIFKRLMKLRKMAGYSGCTGLDLSRAVVKDDGAIPSSNSWDSSLQRGYDSDPNSDGQSTSAGSGCVGTPYRDSSASAFDILAGHASSSSSSPSTDQGHGTPKIAANANSHKPGSQMMANMLLSLVSDVEARCSNVTLEEDDEGECSSSTPEEYHSSKGPRECAWHQAEDDILTELEWRHRNPQDGKPTASAFAASWKLQTFDLSWIGCYQPGCGPNCS